MIDLSEEWESGKWFMTYDSDQFYSDSMIEEFHGLNKENDYDLLTAVEMTFFTNFGEYTTDFQWWTWNNMPHRIKENSIIISTRTPVLETFFRRLKYIEAVETKNIGSYFHYKIKSKERFDKTYEVGDRSKEGKYENCELKPLDRDHPSVVQEYIPKLRERLL
jgi:hypothetical protein